MSDEKRGSRSKSLKRRSVQSKLTTSEFDVINRIKTRALKSQDGRGSPVSSLITHHSSLLHGIGDDAAVLSSSSEIDRVVTTDLLVENIDFRREWTSPQLLGHKALAVSLSDIAAMGARPRYALLSIGIPKKLWSTNFVDELYEGFFALADEHGVTLIGGDVSRSPDRVVIDSIVIGEVKRGRAVLRSRAKPGDHIFVTGSLGGAAAGLKLLEGGARVNNKKLRSHRAVAEQKLLSRQLKPEPRVAWGTWLGEKQLATSMIDISDGLSSDLIHLCEASGIGASIDAARIPSDPNVGKSGRKHFEPIDLALNGGEDFELLFTVSPNRLKKVLSVVCHPQVADIGFITKDKSVLLTGSSGSVSITARGFTHF